MADATPSAEPRSAPWLRSFAADEARAWLFVAKSLLAVYVGAWLAMLLHLEQPSTTMITVAIVMHPQSGMVLAKSFYRAIGTVAGSLAGLLLISTFPQQREVFLLGLSLWITLCASGAVLYRNFMAYGFVLAGYTAAIVALPVIGNPLAGFESAQMRVSEVLLGILVAGVVSDVVFPERLRAVLRRSAHAQFDRFFAFLRDSLAGSLPQTRMEEVNLEFVRAAVQLEDLRASVIFEDPEVRARSSHLRLLNQRYMAAATTFQSLHHLLNRLQRQGQTEVVSALTALYQPLHEALTLPAARAPNPSGLLAQRLERFQHTLVQSIAAQRQALAQPSGSLEFATGAALLQRLAAELHDYARTDGALRAGVIRAEQERMRFHRSNDWSDIGLTALRTFLTMTVLSVFWIQSGWAFGATTMLLATVFSGLLASAPNPVSAVLKTLYGFAAGMLVAAFVEFRMLPMGDSFPFLVAATLPFLLLGPYLSTRPRFAGFGTGYTISVLLNLGLRQPMLYNPEVYFNSALSQLGGLAAAAAAFMLLPGQVSLSRQLRRLRQLVATAASARLEGLVWQFETRLRDLVQQAVVHTPAGSAQSRILMAWSLAVQESGRTLIELRHDLAAGTLPDEARARTEAAIGAIDRLYRMPDSSHWQQADAAVNAAIAAMPEGPARNHLYQIHSALHDTESPLFGPLPIPVPNSTHAT
ncbi:MAG: FUSC family protein [Thiomonas sp.]|uniref:FUSC family protein n=1 Tax=Thiomonas sp. TaxID=2047785 RepID=UPI002A366C8F|nr:FUSC family protein [Thiomonas sp.]MDY0331563.1 FUSC family protein [Thiomonas sp.]